MALGVACGIARAYHAVKGWTAPELAGELRANSTKVETVDIRGSRFSRDEFYQIFQALSGNTNCVAFIAHNAELDDDAAGMLADAVAQHPALERLGLQVNWNLGDAGVNRIASALRRNRSVNELWLAETGVRLEGARSLAAMLFDNWALRVVDLRGCKIPPTGIQMLKNTSGRSRTLRKLLVGDFWWWPGTSTSGLSEDTARQIAEVAEMMPTNLDSSNFGVAYATALPYPDKTALFQGIEAITAAFAAGKGAGAGPAAAHAARIHQEINAKEAASGLTGVHELAGVAWTSQDELPIGSDTFAFYNMVQDLARRDEPGTLMQEGVRYCRTLNLFVVNRGPGAAPIVFPAMTERGTWLPQLEVEFFTANLVYRYPGYLASSDDIGNCAREFLQTFARPMNTAEKFLPVRFVFYFDTNLGCRHVNLMVGLSVLPHEREWLFQHYSSFRVRTPANLSAGPFSPSNPVVIEIDVIPDNRLVPLDAILAQWH